MQKNCKWVSVISNEDTLVLRSVFFLQHSFKRCLTQVFGRTFLLEIFKFGPLLLIFGERDGKRSTLLRSVS